MISPCEKNKSRRSAQPGYAQPPKSLGSRRAKAQCGRALHHRDIIRRRPMRQRTFHNRAQRAVKQRRRAACHLLYTLRAFVRRAGARSADRKSGPRKPAPAMSDEAQGGGKEAHQSTGNPVAGGNPQAHGLRTRTSQRFWPRPRERLIQGARARHPPMHVAAPPPIAMPDGRGQLYFRENGGDVAARQPSAASRGRRL